MNSFQKEKALELLDDLEKAGINAVSLFPGANMTYYTGFKIGLSERLAAAVLPVEGDPWFVVNELEAELRGQDPWFRDVAIWREYEDPITILSETLQDRGLDTATLGLPLEAPWSWANRLYSELPDAEFVDASENLHRLRMIKDDQEIEWIRMACVIADKSMEAGFGEIYTGMSEKEVGILTSEMNQLGAGSTFCSVLFSERAALPHGSPSSRELRVGDSILVDMGATVHGYWSDLTRTVFYGVVEDNHKKLFNVVRDANRVAFEKISPGVTAESVDLAARQVIQEAGYGDKFIHRLGHGIGLEVHERPYIVRNNKLELEPGMVFSDEPGIYLMGDIGIRVEDTVVCTREGAADLTKFNRELKVYPSKD
ncbi:MAG: M24 family metallopeptidase [Candidatus Bathyarchaeia archaeon]